MAQVLRRLQWRGGEKLETGFFEDAAVLKETVDGRLVTSVDVFTPTVDDPYEFGQIGAANSMSDIYAMGGDVVVALAVLGYPPSMYHADDAAAILQGAIDKVAEAGGVLAGGHTVKSSEVLFGLSVIGKISDPTCLTKSGATVGDVLVLTKPLGLGIITTAIKARRLSTAEITKPVEVMKQLNRNASLLARKYKATACTDVTGFGLLGHLFEIAKHSNITFELWANSVPVLQDAEKLAEEGFVPGGSMANLKYYSQFASFASSIDQTRRIILADAQTSGGLLICLRDSVVDYFISDLNEQKEDAWIVGAAVKKEQNAIRVIK